MSYLRGHSGTVLCMDFSATLGKSGLLFTGAADRCIKVWDLSEATPAHGGHHNNAGACVQTIHAHGGSVVCLRSMPHQHGGLVSCSPDQTVKTWFPAEGRALLVHPWFVPGQTITFASGTWPTMLCIRDGASCTLFVGDSTGCLSLYTAGGKASEDDDSDGQRRRSLLLSPEPVASSLEGNTSDQLFQLKRSHAHFHSLGILQLQLIEDHCFVVSLGFDHKAHVVDAISGALSSTIVNTNGTRFTSCAWDARGQLLLLGDAVGCLHLWNVFHDKLEAKRQLFPATFPILSMSVLPSTSGADLLLMGVANAMKQWRVNRDVGYAQCMGHTDAIVSIVVMHHEDEQLFQPQSNDDEQDTTTTSRFFSASLDNTLRCWDSYTMKASFGFEEREAEVTCLIAAKTYSKLITGHENGAIKAWSTSTGKYLRGRQTSSSGGSPAISCLASKWVSPSFRWLTESLIIGGCFSWRRAR